MKKLICFLSTLVILCCIVSCDSILQGGTGETPEHIHSFGEWETEKAPTCTVDGEKARYCSCGETQKAGIPASGHNYEDGECQYCGDIIACKHKNLDTLPAVAATCTEAGKTEGTICLDCNEVIVSQTATDAKGHKYVDGICENCKDIIVCVHSTPEIIKAESATCVKPGLTQGIKCSVCEEVLVAQEEIPALGHTDEIDSAVDPTCSTLGKTEGKHCSVCKEVLVAQEDVEMLDHTYTNDFDATCENCDFIREVDCAHTEVTKLEAREVSCTVDGLSEGLKCSICQIIIQPQIVTPAPGHSNVTDEALAPTCTTAGKTEGKHCSVCHKITLEQGYLPALGHNEGDWIVEKEATESDTGYRYKICSTCKNKTTEEITPCLGNLGLEYTVNSDGKSVTITGIGSFAGTELAIPAEINGYKVTFIGESAFSECTRLTTIIIPDTTKTIGYRAFYGCTGLTEITIPASVTSIGTQVLYKASNLSTVYYNSTYSSSSNPFLKLSHITKVVFNGSYVPTYILQDCANITEVVIGDNVTAIKDYAFKGCASLASMVIPDNVKSIGLDAFNGCNSLTEVTIGKAVTSIGSDTFYKCTSLTEVTIGNAVTSIGSYAFYSCTSLKAIELPNSVTSIGGSAFSGCTSLASAKISNKLKTIESHTFRDCDALTSIVIPDSVTSIGSNAFYDCDALTSIVIPDSVTDIGTYAFYVCKNLVSVEIMFGVDTIPEGAFSSCTSLESIIIPGSVTSIGGKAFENCNSLKNVYISDVEKWCNINFSDNPLTHGADLYLNNELVTNLVIPDNVSNISSYAFQKCKSIISVTIGENSQLVSIGSYAFEGCSQLTSVVIHNGVTTIGSNAFRDCNSLTSVVIGDSVTTIDSYALFNCHSITSIDVDANNEYYKSIDGNLYSKDGKLLIKYAVGKSDTIFVIPNDVTTIGDYAFRDCSGLTSVVIGDSVTTIGYYAFYDCYDLKDVYYTGSEDEWKNITISGNNYQLTGATIHYNYVPED